MRLPCVPSAGCLRRLPTIEHPLEPMMTSPRSKNDLSFAPVATVNARMRDSGLPAVALTDYCLDRVGVLNPGLNAFITVTADLARGQARASQSELRAGRWRGPLHGIPVAVKDFYDTAGIRTTAGFAQFENRVPSQDAEMVRRLRDAGAVLLGKTNMHRLGMGTTSLDSHFGPVINPWSANHVAGGSSGGSAVAVAAGLCFVTVDTDAIGSGRLPAAICGVICHKPTFGILSTAGILAGEETDPAILLLSHPCITARSAEDVALAFEALIAVSMGDAPSFGASLHNPVPVRRVGVVTNFVADDEVKAVFAEAVASVAKMGIGMLETRVPFEAATFDVSSIESDRATINASLFGDIDAVMLPTLTAPTPTVDDARAIGDMAVSPDNTFFCNYFGLPAISVPSGIDHNGLPLGLQFVGPQGSDTRVVALAHAYQQATRWRYKPPPVALLKTR
jgi:aspartyl-tRNA(Asn)/glutamyl-tRNA(Gln) amidotransferase subunit A